MEENAKIISEKRTPIKTPADIVDENGNCVFGTFDGEFEKFSLTKAKKPTHLPQCFNRQKLTLWQAVEINFGEIMFLTAVCDMGIFGQTLTLVYDKETKKVTSFGGPMPKGRVSVAEKMTGGAKTSANGKNLSILFENNMQRDEFALKGDISKKSEKVSYDIVLTRAGSPSVVSIPFGKNRPLYSQKDLFTVKGSLTFGGKTYTADAETTAIVDDHRGYYPRRMAYDWVTAMGFYDTAEGKTPFGFNLTHNQSTDETDYNENLIWLGKKRLPLPPVRFSRTVESRDFTSESVWTVKDEYGRVDIKFRAFGINPMVIHALVVNIDYYFFFGCFEGTLRDEDGNIYSVDGMMGMGEDKSMLF